MKRLSFLTFIFAILSAVFFLLLIFLRIPFPLYPLMSVQDAVDLLTPLVLIPVYWLLFIRAGDDRPGIRSEIVFMVMAAFWVAGQGMHLSANSINNLSESTAIKQVIDITKTQIYELTYFYDEYLSHFLWHIGVIGLASLLIFRAWQLPSGQKTSWVWSVLGGLIYGFTCFCIFLEGNTVILGMPFAILISLILLIWRRKNLGQQPILAFFLISFLITALLFAYWGIRYQGFPPFSDPRVGLI